MRSYSQYTKYATSFLLVTSAFATGNALAETKPFVALITTHEVLSVGQTASCPLVGTTVSTVANSNLFTKNARTFSSVTLTATDCVYPSPDFTSFRFIGDKFTLAGDASNSINATYQGTVTINPDLTYTLNGTFSVNGGTGIYKNATGSGILTGTEFITPPQPGQLPPPATGQLQAVGKISY